MKRLCLDCAKPVESGNRCALHRRERARERGPRAYDRKRYKVARRKVLGHLCACAGCGACTHVYGGRACEAVAEEADHIVPLAEGGDAFALSNLRGLCRACHIERHRGRVEFLAEENETPPIDSRRAPARIEKSPDNDHAK